MFRKEKVKIKKNHWKKKTWEIFFFFEVVFYRLTAPYHRCWNFNHHEICQTVRWILLQNLLEKKKKGARWQRNVSARFFWWKNLAFLLFVTEVEKEGEEEICEEENEKGGEEEICVKRKWKRENVWTCRWVALGRYMKVHLVCKTLVNV